MPSSVTTDVAIHYDLGSFPVAQETQALWRFRRVSHATQVIVKPRFIFIVYYVFIQQNTGKLAKEVFKMSKVIDFYRLKFGSETADFIIQLGIQSAFQSANVVFTGHLFGQFIETLFKRTVKRDLPEPVFYEVDAMPTKTNNENYAGNNSHDQEKRDRNRRNTVYDIVQNIP
jgi:hypothetical protein